MKVGVLESESRPISECRILQRHVGLYSDNGLTWFVGAFEHTLPEHSVVFWSLGSAGTVGLRNTVFFELICGASADVSKPALQHFGGVFVIDVDSVRCDDHSVRLTSDEPCRFFLDALIGLEHRGFHFGIRVVKPEDEFALVHRSIGAVDDQATSMTEGKGAVGVGCKPQHDLPVLCVFKVRQPFSASFRLSFFEQVWCFPFENSSNSVKTLLSSHGVGISHALCDESRYRLPVLLEVFPHAHDATNDRTNRCLTFVLQSVLQRNMIDEVQRLLIWTPCHVARVDQTMPLQEMRVSSCWKS